MSEENTITLAPKQHDKIGIYHVGVTREGFISVAGDPKNIDDGQEISFERSGITAKRNGSEYTFTRA
jgi:hypothetical protein